MQLNRRAYLPIHSLPHTVRSGYVSVVLGGGRETPVKRAWVRQEGAH